MKTKKYWLELSMDTYTARSTSHPGYGAGEGRYVEAGSIAEAREIARRKTFSIWAADMVRKLAREE